MSSRRLPWRAHSRVRWPIQAVRAPIWQLCRAIIAPSTCRNSSSRVNSQRLLVPTLESKLCTDIKSSSKRKLEWTLQVSQARYVNHRQQIAMTFSCPKTSRNRRHLPRRRGPVSHLPSATTESTSLEVARRMAQRTSLMVGWEAVALTRRPIITSRARHSSGAA